MDTKKKKEFCDILLFFVLLFYHIHLILNKFY